MKSVLLPRACIQGRSENFHFPSNISASLQNLYSKRNRDNLRYVRVEFARDATRYLIFFRWRRFARQDFRIYDFRTTDFSLSADITRNNCAEKSGLASVHSCADRAKKGTRWERRLAKYDSGFKPYKIFFSHVAPKKNATVLAARYRYLYSTRTYLPHSRWHNISSLLRWNLLVRKKKWGALPFPSWVNIFGRRRTYFSINKCARFQCAILSR